MKFLLTNKEISFLYGLVDKTAQITEAKNPKPQEESGKLLIIYKQILEELHRVLRLPNNEGEATFNRVEAKCLLQQMQLSEILMKKVKTAYETQAEDLPPFNSKEPGRSKVDYLRNIEERLSVIKSINTKITLRL